MLLNRMSALQGKLFRRNNAKHGKTNYWKWHAQWKIANNFQREKKHEELPAVAIWES